MCYYVCGSFAIRQGAMKKMNIVIDEKLVRAGMRATGLKTRRALVDHALRELLRRGPRRAVSKRRQLAAQ
jgi:Arc/MetJ family transcription regulator